MSKQEKVTGNAFNLGLFLRVMSYVKPYKGRFVITAILTVLLAILGPMRPWLIQYAIDNFVVTPNYTMLLNFTLLQIGLLIVEAGFQFYYTYLTSWLGQVVIKDLRLHVYNKITHFKLRYFDTNQIGTLVTRTISDIETIANIFSEGILMIIGDVLKLTGVVVMMFYTDWRLALLSLISVPVLLIATNIFKNAIKKAFIDVRNEVAKLNAFVQEHITGMNIVQVFNREQIEMERFKVINARHRDAHIRSVFAYSVFFPVVEILSALSLALVVWWGAKEVIAQTVTFGNLVAFILYIYMLFRPIRQLADRFNVLQMGMVSSERVFKVIDTEASISNTGKLDAALIKGEIAVKDLWFAYNETDYVLKGISFDAKPGQKIALVGATGAGKSSVINLLSRFYEFNKGALVIDGHSVRDYELNSLRRNIGVVLQDVFLFSDSIFNNITLNNPAITKEQVVHAAQMVGAHDFIMKLPGDYGFEVKERGGMLSVGQRQLISFIRAYVYNPKILVLDEATSSIDTESEQMIQRATEVLTEGRTSVIIAHRLATIQHADRIIVMDHGEVKEMGNHQELLKQNGLYKNLFELQFKERVE